MNSFTKTIVLSPIITRMTESYNFLFNVLNDSYTINIEYIENHILMKFEVSKFDYSNFFFKSLKY